MATNINMTFPQVESFVRAYAGELDTTEVTAGEIIIWATLAQRKVQTDTMAMGVKKYVKTIQLTSDENIEPNDIYNVPNAVIDVMTSNGVQAKYTVTGYTGFAAGPVGGMVIIHTAKQPGPGGNKINVYTDSLINSINAPASGTVLCSYSNDGTYDHLVCDFGVSSTLAQITSGFNNDPIYSQYLVCTTNHSLTETVNLPNQSTSGLLTGGSGAGWYPCRELSIENYNRVQNNIYKTPSITDPTYCLYGTATGTRLIRLLPKGMTSANMTYYYLIPDVSATGSLSVPPEHEELVLTQILIKMFDKLAKGTMKAEMEAKYAEAMAKVTAGYQNELMANVQEKTRMESTDLNK